MEEWRILVVPTWVRVAFRPALLVWGFGFILGLFLGLVSFNAFAYLFGSELLVVEGIGEEKEGECGDRV